MLWRDLSGLRLDFQKDVDDIELRCLFALLISKIGKTKYPEILK